MNSSLSYLVDRIWIYRRLEKSGIESRRTSNDLDYRLLFEWNRIYLVVEITCLVHIYAPNAMIGSFGCKGWEQSRYAGEGRGLDCFLMMLFKHWFWNTLGAETSRGLCCIVVGTFSLLRSKSFILNINIGRNTVKKLHWNIYFENPSAWTISTMSSVLWSEQVNMALLQGK